MTIYAKTTPVGIDKEIYDWQLLLDDCFPVDADVYGRLYINERKDNTKIAEAYVADGEYKEIFLDDTKNAIIGFMIDETRSGFNLIKCNVNVICSCNLDKLYGSTTREDEKALLTVFQIIKRNILSPYEGQIKTKMSDVFAGLSIDKFKFRDMHPWFNFSISFSLVYRINT